MKRACLTTPGSNEPNGEYTQPDDTMARETCAHNRTNNDDAPGDLFRGWIMSQTVEIDKFQTDADMDRAAPRLWNTYQQRRPD